MGERVARGRAGARRLGAVLVVPLVLLSCLVDLRPPGGRVRPFPRTGPYLLNGTGSPDPVRVMDGTGLRWFTFAFITASPAGECRAMWNGWEELAPGDIEHGRLAAIRARGGDAVIAFGGAGGRKLTQSCPTVDALYGQYRRVIELYRPKAIDVDVEGEELTHVDDHPRLIEALRRIRQDFDVAVSVTLPVFVNGLGGAGRAFFDAAPARGLVVDNWTVMAFDYGADRFDAGSGRWLTLVEAAQRSVDAVAAQVAERDRLVPAEAYWRVGLSSMNGRTDFFAATGEVVTLADFEAMRDLARRRHLGRFTFWALNRDRPCTDPADLASDVSNRCSHLAHGEGEFATVAAAYTR